MHVQVFTTNALSVDLAHFVASDVFVMAASALSNLAAFLRGARSDWSSGSSGGGGFVVTDLRNDHLPEVGNSSRSRYCIHVLLTFCFLLFHKDVRIELNLNSNPT